MTEGFENNEMKLLKRFISPVRDVQTYMHKTDIEATAKNIISTG